MSQRATLADADIDTLFFPPLFQGPRQTLFCPRGEAQSDNISMAKFDRRFCFWLKNLFLYYIL